MLAVSKTAKQLSLQDFLHLSKLLRCLKMYIKWAFISIQMLTHASGQMSACLTNINFFYLIIDKSFPINEQII